MIEFPLSAGSQTDGPKGGGRRGSGHADAWIVPALVALLLHVALLVPIRWTWPADTSPRPAVQVRIVETPALRQAQVFAEVRPGAEAQASLAAGRPSPVAAPSLRPARQRPPSSPLQTQSVIDGSAPAAGAVPPPSSAPGAEATGDAPATPPPDDVIPTYRTRVPPSANLRYAMRRGSLQGTGELEWRADGAGYRVSFVGSVAGVSVLAQASRGAFDAAGLAPERYTDRRSKRLLATNFRRDAGHISFSGESGSQPLLPGSQDRLSWLVQLAAVLSAEPERSRPGEAVSMAVAGVRGEPAIWTFVSLGPDSATDGAAAPASAEATPDPVTYGSPLKFVRESRGPYDTRVEVWVDPARHHLPVRVRFTGATEAQMLELRLQRLEWEP